MADPQAAALTQLRNIETKTGKRIAELHAALAETGLVKAGERRSWLIEHFGLGYGDANAVALTLNQTPPADDGEPLADIYTGAKAHLRPLHEAVIALVDGFGPYEKAPKKANVSLRRKKQFALIGPATKDLLEVGLNHKALPAHARLKIMAPGGMCQATVRLGSAEEIDAELAGWLRLAYDAAG